MPDAPDECFQCGKPTENGLVLCWRCYGKGKPVVPERTENEIGTGRWAGWEEPLYVSGPTDGLVFFGAATGWSPGREGQAEVSCKTCGGVLVFDGNDANAALPIHLPSRIRDELPGRYVLVTQSGDPISGDSNRLCGSCLRWAKDNWLARVIDREYAQRGSNAPIAVKIHEGGSVPLPA